MQENYWAWLIPQQWLQLIIIQLSDAEAFVLVKYGDSAVSLDSYFMATLFCLSRSQETKTQTFRVQALALLEQSKGNQDWLLSTLK